MCVCVYIYLKLITRYWFLKLLMQFSSSPWPRKTTIYITGPAKRTLTGSHFHPSFGEATSHPVLCARKIEQEATTIQN